jgi:hypothetical protein
MASASIRHHPFTTSTASASLENSRGHEPGCWLVVAGSVEALLASGGRFMAFRSLVEGLTVK